MPEDLTKAALETKTAQRSQAKRATFAKLKNKKRAEREFTAELGGDPATLLYRAIGATAYDKLLTRHPPTKEQLADGAAFNSNTFAPALLAQVCVDPALDATEWGEIWNSEDWNRGEVSELFWNAVELCNKGLELTPTAAG
jgi:hypothetical protein